MAIIPHVLSTHHIVHFNGYKSICQLYLNKVGKTTEGKKRKGGFLGRVLALWLLLVPLGYKPFGAMMSRSIDKPREGSRILLTPDENDKRIPIIFILIKAYSIVYLEKVHLGHI